MANTIKLRRSAVQGAIPTTAQLALGELALNTYDGKLYTKKDDGTATIVEIGAGGGGGGISYTVSSTAPSSPSNGDMWFDLNTAIQFSWIDDGNSAQWIETGRPGTAGAGATDLDGLTDVDLTTVAPIGGEVLYYNQSNSNWIPIPLQLTYLSDTDLFTNPPSNGQALVYNSSTFVWEPGNVVTDLDSLSDVDLTTTPPTGGQSLVYNSNTSLWEPQTVAGGGGSGLASTAATNIATAHTTGTEFQTFGNTPYAKDIQWDNTGFNFYVLNADQSVPAGTPSIDQYACVTAYDITTAYLLYTQSLSNNFNPSTFVFGSSGSKVYAVESGTIYEYNLSTAYDITTISYNQTSSYIGCDDFVFDSSGTQIITVGGASYGTIQTWSLSTAWDISTAGYLFGYDIDFGTVLADYAIGGASYIEINSAGTKLYAKEGGTNLIYQFDLSSAFDTSTAVFSDPPLKLVPHENNTTVYNGFTLDLTQLKAWLVTHLNGSNTTFVEIDIDPTNCESVTAPKVLFDGDVQVEGALSSLGSASFKNMQTEKILVQNEARILTEGYLRFGNDSQVAFVYGQSNTLDTTFASTGEWTIYNNNFATAYRFDQTNSDLYVTNLVKANKLSTDSYLELTDTSNFTYTRFEAPSSLTSSTTFTLPDNTHTSLQAMRTSQASLNTLEWFYPSTLNEPNVYTAAQIGTIVTLTDQATIAMDLALGNNFELTLGGNRLFDNPTNMLPGQVGSIFIVQDGSGSRTLSWGAYWLFPGGVAPTLSTTPGAQDRIDFIVKSATEIQAQFAGDFQ